MYPRTLVLVSLCAGLMGCGRKGAPEAAPTGDAQSIQGQPGESEEDVSALLGELTQAVRKFSAEQRRVPASLSELVSSGYLKQLPAAPPGKSFAIDPKELKVVIR